MRLPNSCPAATAIPQVLHHGVSRQQDAGCELPPIQLNLSPQVSCVWHAILFNFSASNSSSSLLLLSFQFSVLCSQKPNSCKTSHPTWCRTIWYVSDQQSHSLDGHANLRWNQPTRKARSCIFFRIFISTQNHAIAQIVLLTLILTYGLSVKRTL